MSDEQRQARRRADGCAIGAEALTPLLLVLKDARNDAARKLVGPVRVEFDALAILREAAEQWPGHWFTVCVALAADPAVTDSGGDPGNGCRGVCAVGQPVGRGGLDRAHPGRDQESAVRPRPPFRRGGQRGAPPGRANPERCRMSAGPCCPVCRVGWQPPGISGGSERR